MSQHDLAQSESGVTSRARRAIRWAENLLRSGRASQRDRTEPYPVESSVSVPSTPQFVTYRSDRFYVKLEERNF
jgi:hypothetical protein